VPGVLIALLEVQQVHPTRRRSVAVAACQGPPTSASWMNQVETFFGLLTRQAVRRGSFASVPDLVAAISRYIQAWKADCHPFVWVKDADQILVKAASGASQRGWPEVRAGSACWPPHRQPWAGAGACRADCVSQGS
jgi:hypothetical protein